MHHETSKSDRDVYLSSCLRSFLIAPRHFQPLLCVQTESAQRGKYALSTLSTSPKLLKSLLSPCSFLLLNSKSLYATRIKHHHATTAVAQPIHLQTSLITESNLMESYLIKSINSMLACHVAMLVCNNFSPYIQTYYTIKNSPGKLMILCPSRTLMGWVGISLHYPQAGPLIKHLCVFCFF